MSQWDMGSSPDPQTGEREFCMNITTDDSTGAMNGTVIFQDVTYNVSGEWAASGSLPGRNYSAFYLGGSDGQTAPMFVACTGTMKGPGNAPQEIALNLVRTDTTDGLQYGYDGELAPL